MYNSNIEIPLYIGGEEITTKNKKNIYPPHDHNHIIGKYNIADKNNIETAIDCALKAKENWSNLDWNHRVAIFLKSCRITSWTIQR